MDHPLSRRSFLASSAAISSAATLSGCLGGKDPEQQVEEHRESLERYADVATTVEEGYRTAATYVHSDDGTLGETLINFDVPELEPDTPQVVFYALDEDGQYVPLGCKWFVNAEERDSAPSLFGKSFRGPIESDVPFLDRHYALHVWTFEDNPDGMFARYHPAIDPPPYLETLRAARGAISELATGGKAEDRGYHNTEQCIPGDGGIYGVPFVREKGDVTGGTDPTNPPIVLYRVTENWSYVLLGAEWYRPVDAVDEPSTMFGQQFHEPMASHSGKTAQPEHYGLHAWLYRTNPRGMFAPFNPVAVC